MAIMTIDTLKLADKLESAGCSREQAGTVLRAIAESQYELVTKKNLDIELAPLKTDLEILKWGTAGFLIAGGAAQRLMSFFQLPSARALWRNQDWSRRCTESTYSPGSFA